MRNGLTTADMGHAKHPFNPLIVLLVGFCCLAACQNPAPPRHTIVERPILEPTASEILLTPQLYTLTATPKNAYLSPENYSSSTNPVSTIDEMRIMTFSPEQIATQVQPFKDRTATEIQGYKERADITLENNGQTFTYTVQSRFFVFLDDDKYPLSQLKCEPEWVIAYISNGSFRGPDRYPIYFEARRPGKCVLQNGDFSVTIVVAQRPPVLPIIVSPTPTFTINYPTPPAWDYKNHTAFQAPIGDFERNSAFEVVEYLFRHHMDRFLDKSVSEGQRIIAYKIENIELLNDQYSKRFKKEHPANYLAVADIVFSVIPARYIYSDWQAGNGEYHQGDTWISRKSVYYAVIEKDGLYILVGIGTSL